MAQPGILNVNADLAKQLVKIEGTGIAIPLRPHGSSNTVYKNHSLQLLLLP